MSHPGGDHLGKPSLLSETLSFGFHDIFYSVFNFTLTATQSCPTDLPECKIKKMLAGI